MRPIILSPAIPTLRATANEGSPSEHQPSPNRPRNREQPCVARRQLVRPRLLLALRLSRRRLPGLRRLLYRVSLCEGALVFALLRFNPFEPERVRSGRRCLTRVMARGVTGSCIFPPSAGAPPGATARRTSRRTTTKASAPTTPKFPIRWSSGDKEEVGFGCAITAVVRNPTNFFAGAFAPQSDSPSVPRLFLPRFCFLWKCEINKCRNFPVPAFAFECFTSCRPDSRSAP